MLSSPSGADPSAASSCHAPEAALKPAALALSPERMALPEPWRRRMALYEVDQACSYAAVPDLPRMQHRLASACADLQQLRDCEPQMETARLRVIEALSKRATVAAQEGDAAQTQQLVDQMAALAKACKTPSMDADMGLVLLAEAHGRAFQRAAEEARYSAEFGDACQLRAKLEEADKHPGPWSLRKEDRALLLTVCTRRLCEAETSLLARLPSKPFVDSQLAAVEALAADLGAPVPQTLRDLAALLLTHPAPEADAEREREAEGGAVLPGEMGPGTPEFPLLVAQSEAQACLYE